MNPEIKKRWLEALRSGEYKQASGFLRKDDCFCAQGVLCDLYAKEKNIAWDLNIGKSGRHSILSMWTIIPYKIEIWSGLVSDKISISESKSLDMVINLNDKQKKSFSEIADYIENNL